MKDWKMWAPLQTKEQREISDNLSPSEKEEAMKLSEELGKKSAFSIFPCFLIVYLLYKYILLPSNIKLLFTIALITVDYILFMKFVGLPIRKKQKSLLNNSKYAKEKGLTV